MLRNPFIIILAISLIAGSSASKILSQIVDDDFVLEKDFLVPSQQLEKASHNFSSSTSDSIGLSLLKTDFMINSLGGDFGSNQYGVSCAIDGDGNFAFAWIDERNDWKEIYAQFYNKEGVKIGKNFKVNETDLSGNNQPFIASNNKGNFVIVWLGDFNRVFAQRLSNSGQKVGGNFIVNQNFGGNTTYPSAAIEENGHFMVTWGSESYVNPYGMYARLFDETGMPLSEDIVVNEIDKRISSVSQGSHIAVNEKGNYCIVWSSGAGTSESNIYLQMIDKFGERINNNIKVNNQNPYNSSIFPEIISTGKNDFLIAWVINSNIGIRIYYGGENFNDDDIYFSDNWNSYPPFSISSDRDSIYYVQVSSIGNRYFHKIKSNGEFIGDKTPVELYSEEFYFSHNYTATDLINNTFYVGHDVTNKLDADVQFQKFDGNFTKIGTMQIVHDDTSSSPQNEALVEFNNLGESIVLWKDRRNGREDLFARVYDADFNPKNSGVMLNEPLLKYWFLSAKAASSLSNGNFAVVFAGSDWGSTDSVFLQIVDRDGNKAGNNIVVKNKVYGYNNCEVEVQTNIDDEIIVCWYNGDGATYQIYDSQLNKIGSPNIFLKSSDYFSYQPISVSIDENFKIFTAWNCYSKSEYVSQNKIYGQFHDAGSPTEFPVFTIDSVYDYISIIECIRDDDNFAVLYSNDNDLNLKRKYDKDGEVYFEQTINSCASSFYNYEFLRFDNRKILLSGSGCNEAWIYYLNDNSQQLERLNLHYYDKIYNILDNFNGKNSAALYEDKLFFAFQSNKNNGTSSDIWGNVWELSNVDFSKELFFKPVKKDFLYNNYPNPFNAKTKITYQLLSYHKVKLSIYDVLGREVEVLVDEYKEKGVYEVDFESDALASGIYFCRLEAFDTIIKKMIILK